MNGINRQVDFAMKKLTDIGAINKESKGIMIIRDCILVENNTGKSYTYRAFNYLTGHTQYLGHRKVAMNTEQYTIVTEKIKELPFYNTEIPREANALIDYIFKNIFTNYGYVVRNNQVELSKRMYQSLMGREILLSDIPVGLGKTHAYLVAAIVYNFTNRRNYFERRNYIQSTDLIGQTPMPIVISTSSIQLQKAIEKEYIPDISRMLLENGIIDTPITSVLRKGKENYLCDIRLKNYVNTLDPKKKSSNEMAELKKLLIGNKIDLGEITGITYYDKRKIVVRSDLCYKCNQKKQCKYQRFMERAKSFRYVIIITILQIC